MLLCFRAGGSTWLAQEMRAHPEIGCGGEALSYTHDQCAPRHPTVLNCTMGPCYVYDVLNCSATRAVPGLDGAKQWASENLAPRADWAEWMDAQLLARHAGK